MIDKLINIEINDVTIVIEFAILYSDFSVLENFESFRRQPN